MSRLADTITRGRMEVVAGLLGQSGEAFSNVASGISDIVTAVAVLVGGIWAYRKFIQGRTFKPRLSVELQAQWHFLAGTGHVLHVRTQVANIGASKVSLTPRGTGLTIAFPAPRQTSAVHRRTDQWWADIRWAKTPLLQGDAQARTFVILKSHEWIEPGEMVSDDILLNLGRAPTIAQVELHLLWRLPRWWWKDKMVRLIAREIVPSDSVIVDNR